MRPCSFFFTEKKKKQKGKEHGNSIYAPQECETGEKLPPSARAEPRSIEAFVVFLHPLVL
jgi:hypothetical protein